MNISSIGIGSQRFTIFSYFLALLNFVCFFSWFFPSCLSHLLSFFFCFNLLFLLLLLLGFLLFKRKAIDYCQSDIEGDVTMKMVMVMLILGDGDGDDGDVMVMMVMVMGDGDAKLFEGEEGE